MDNPESTQKQPCSFCRSEWPEDSMDQHKSGRWYCSDRNIERCYASYRKLAYPKPNEEVA